MVNLQFRNKLQIIGLLHQSAFKILDLVLASNKGNLFEERESDGPMGVPLWWALWLGIRVPLLLMTGQGPWSDQTELLFVRGRNTPGRFVAHLKNDWAWNGDCLDYTETHPLISFSGPQKAWWRFSPSQWDLMPKVSVTHLHREQGFWKRGSPLFQCVFFLLSFCSVHFRVPGVHF